MAIFVTATGNNGVDGQVDGTTFRAMVVSYRPADYASYGVYRYFSPTGTLGTGTIGNQSVVLGMKWGDANGRIAAFVEINISVGHSVAATTAGFGNWEVIILRNVQTLYTGTTNRDMTGKTNKLRTKFPPSLMTQIMGGGTTATTAPANADPDAFGVANVAGANITGILTTQLNGQTLPYTRLLGDSTSGLFEPLILSQNEAISIRSSPTSGGFGTTLVSKVGIGAQWQELMGY